MPIEENVEKKKRVKRSTSVPGQAYGYMVQEVRVLWRLLRATSGDVVAFEHLGDVSVQTANGVLSEEDKSGLAHNPIADRAVALWKTLANWADARRDGLLPAASIYVLYVVQPYDGEIADKLHCCVKAAEAVQLVADLRKHFAEDLAKEVGKKAGKGAMKKVAKEGAYKVAKGGSVPVDGSANNGGDKDDDSAATLTRQLQRLFAHSDEAIASIVVDFSLEKGTASPVQEVRTEISRSVPDEHLEEVTESLLGWVKTRVMEQIEARRVVGISYDAFRTHRLAVHERVLGALKEFPEHTSIPSRSEIEDHLVGRTYVRQLALLELREDRIESYINDYLRASAARTDWADHGHLNEDKLNIYISELMEHWNQSSLEVETLEAGRTPIQQGVKLLLLCMSKQMLIRTIPVPSYFSRGSFHAIADETKIGWHPDWKAMLAASVK